MHIAGTSNRRADALSRRDQDLLKGADDSRIRERYIQLVKPEWIRPTGSGEGVIVAAVTRQTRAKASQKREGKEEEERLVWSETDQAPEKTGVGIVSD